MLLTDDEYPRFYGPGDTTFYIVPTAGSWPVHVNVCEGELVRDAWPSTKYSREASVALDYPRSKPVAGWQEALRRREITIEVQRQAARRNSHARN